MKPHPDLPEGWEALEWVNAVSGGSGTPHWHVRDQQARILELPPCTLAAADRRALAPARLATYPASIWLPAAARREANDETDGPSAGPSVEVEEWEWPNGDTLVLMITTSPDLPGLHALIGYDTEDERVTVGGRPMRLRRLARSEAVGRSDHSAVVDGHLDDRHDFYGLVRAATPESCDELTALLLTLTVDGGPEAPHPGVDPVGD
jgi:hypothetical protein